MKCFDLNLGCGRFPSTVSRCIGLVFSGFERVAEALAGKPEAGQAALNMSSANLPSCACPAVNLGVIGRPCASVTAGILVVNPPRERPNADGSKVSHPSGAVVRVRPLTRIDGVRGLPPLLLWLLAVGRGPRNCPQTVPRIRKLLKRLRISDPIHPSAPSGQSGCNT